MMNFPPSNSDPGPSSSFSRLHSGVQKWIWDKGWTVLHPIQEKAAKPILGGGKDVIIAAATAGGKTEAAFLPITSRIAEKPAGSIRCLCVSPLKALIDDQYDRLEQLCGCSEVPVHRWHGDVSSTKKQKLLKNPSGILIITPESLEALFVLRGPRIPKIFSSLDFVVIDELHAFVGRERGRQLQSLLHRIELTVRRTIPRIGLSATLGDMNLAAEYLRPDRGKEVVQIVSNDEGQEIKIQLRGYRRTPPRLSAKEVQDADSKGREIQPEDVLTGDRLDIAEHLFKKLRGTDNLIFANNRQTVEELSDCLRRKSENMRVPNEFLPHHGSLSKELREDAESLVKGKERPGNIVCTTTLELGIDIGDVASIAQIGTPHSVSSMRQRLGRSGRRDGQAAVMRIYVVENEITPETSLQDALRAELVQSIAMVNLLLEKWNESPAAEMLHLSTLVQQILSLTAQYGGGVTAKDAWRMLCQSGPFKGLDPSMFAALLRELGRQDLITQTHDGEIVIGLTGEKVVGHYDFFSAFMTSEEFRLVNAGRVLGSLPILEPISEGMYLIFGGRRWKILSIDFQGKVIGLVSAAGGSPPKFSSGGSAIDDKIREKMFSIYRSKRVPVYLNSSAQSLLAEGRDSFERSGLLRQSLVQTGRDVLIFPWKGDRILGTLNLQLTSRGLDISNEGIALLVLDSTTHTVLSHLKALAESGPANPVDLAEKVRNKKTEKYDYCLPEELLCRDYASRKLDTQGAWKTLAQLAQNSIPASVENERAER